MSGYVKSIQLTVGVAIFALSLQPTHSQNRSSAALQLATSGGRDGACSASLADGRSLVTGGKDGSGPIAAVKYFERGGRLRSATPMLTARTDHICMALEDGTVLVAGGVTTRNTATNAAEIFHPDTNAWTPAGPMLTARRKASATLLNSGKVLVVGGEVSGQTINTFEIYDSAADRFEQAPGTLSAARTGYALAALADGRVIVAGGFEGGRVLDSMDVYDPAVGIVYAGRMSLARANFTATAIGDGRVLFVGGNDGKQDLASAEIYDPATGESAIAGSLSGPRKNHIAVRSTTTGNVLIAGGTADGKNLEAAEFFVASEKSFQPAREVADGDSSSPSITIGSLNADATLRRARTYRSIPAIVQPPESPTEAQK